VRLFVAIFPPEVAIAHLKSTVDEMRLGQAAVAGRNVRLDPSEFWHVTLAFLGDVAEDRVPEIEAVLGAVAEAWRREQATRTPLCVAGGGRFGSGPSTIMWAGLHGDSTSLRDLAARVSTELSGAGLMAVDLRPYRPHLTLARCGDRLSADEISADLATLQTYAGPRWTVGELVLVSSVAGPPRRYDHLKSWDLSPA
jgi:2'-5' RNA ligase